jgi:RNA polymerase sigma factor (sigma-70 family)
MAPSRAAFVFRRLRALTGDLTTDRQLLERFLAHRDEDAFAALVERHGGLVFGVCRGVLGHEQDAEDVFQATFLVLARKAASIRKRESLSSWLHGVAYRLARKARSQAARRRAAANNGPRLVPPDPLAELSWRELNSALHEELARLPTKFQAPLVLCCLEGHSRDEAALQLHWTLGMVKDRLERGREMLRRQLVRRGLAPSAALAAALLIAERGSAVAPAALVSSTIGGILRGATGSAGGALSTKALIFAREAMRTMFTVRLKAALLLLTVGLVVGGAGWVAHPAPGSDSEQPGPVATTDAGPLLPRADLYGDPLPPGAVARLGSAQLLHHGLAELVFSEDGKKLTTIGADNAIHTWDVATGKLSGTVRKQGAGGTGQGSTLSPDGKLFAGCENKTVTFWNAETGKEIKRLPAPSWVQQWCYLFFLPDGQTLVVSTPELTRAALWRWQDGTETTLTIPPPKFGGSDSTTHACFSPDGKLLVIGPRQSEPLGIWDVPTGKQLHSLDAQASVSSFSPDGKLLAVASADKGGGGQSVLRLYDVATGNEVRQMPLPGKGFHWWLTYSPDGKIIVPVDTEGIYLLDSSTGKELRRLGGPRIGRQRAVYFSPDGRLLASTGVGRIRLWDVATGKELHERPGAMDEAYGVAYSPDGRLLATGGWVEPTLNIWDPATGRRVRLLETERRNGYVRSLSFSADGGTLVVGRYEGELDFLDAATGKLRRRVSLEEAHAPKQQYAEFRYYSLSAGARRAIAQDRVFAPQDSSRVSIWETDPVRLVASQTFPTLPARGWADLGEKAAFLTPRGIMIADAGTGEFRLLVFGAWDAPLAASPDHRLLAAFDKAPVGAADGKGAATAIHVWETATGKEVAKLPAGPVPHLALSPDGRTLVTADGASLRLWDLATGKERPGIAFPEDFAAAGGDSFVRGLYLSPDGRRATTPLGDTTLLVWDLPSRPMGPAREAFPAEEAGRLWNDLAAEDAAKAYAAVWSLTDAPGPAVMLLRKHLRPIANGDADKVRRLIQELDSENFTTRESATLELEKMGRPIMTVLREALAAKPSPETSRRLEGLLTRLSGGPLSPETLRHLRAIQVLERVGSRDARQVLEDMAGGSPAAPETLEAKAALGRLRGPATATP